MSNDTTKTDIGPGTIIAHSDGDLRVIDRRKEDDTGWWLTDGSGIADWVLDKDYWKVLDQETVRSLWERPDA